MSNEPLNISGAKILVVDDVKENLELMTKFLELEGYEVTFAMSGEKAIQLASLSPPDIILLDVMMPGIDGFETCRRLKSLTSTRGIPVIFVTGQADLEHIVEGFQIGAVDYISKPIQQEEIRVRVKTHLQLQSLLILRDELIEQLKAHNEKNDNYLQIQRQQLIESEKSASLGELVGQLCHEIGTPIGSAITVSSTALEQFNQIKTKVEEGRLTKSELDKLIDVQLESQQLVVSSLTYAAEIIGSFRQVAVGQFSEHIVHFELGQYIQHILRVLGPRLKKTHHTVNVSCAKEVTLYSNPSIFSQIMINLINNSLVHGFKHTDTGQIDIEVAVKGDNLVIEYRDNGTGICLEHLSHVFEKYYTTEKENGGSGLGLYIIKQLVEEKLGGQIENKSEVEHGVYFVIIIPLTEQLLDKSK